MRQRIATALGILAVGLVALAAVAVGLILLFRVLPVPLTPLMVIRMAPIEKQWMALDRIAPALPRSVVASEDNLFCDHWGIDAEAFGAAVDAFMAGEAGRGGSTITQQVAKNLFLWPSRSALRKALELPLAFAIEALWPKRRIVEVYLNIVEWAPGVYGAEAAARHHFDKAASALTRREAALLAAVLPNPLEWSAGRPTAYLRRRAATIERRVTQLGPLLDCVSPVRQGAGKP
ncbi:MAG: monofunctional biosynthetic peptidoglycan transglycosylase [Sneathiellaceae bacterium]